MSPSCRCRSHWRICLLVNVISLEKILPRHNTMFVVVSASVWGKNSLNNWCRYRVQLVLPLFFCTPPFVRDSLFVLASCMPLFVGRTQKIAPVLRGTGVFSCFFSLLLSNVTRTSRSRHAGLRLTEKRRKIAPFLQIQASSMKLIVVFFLYTKVFNFDKKKKRKRALRPDSFLFQWFWHFLKYFNSNHNLPSYSLFSKCFSWFFYLGVHRGTGVFCVVFVILLLSRVTHPRARFAPASVWTKNAEKLRLFCRSRPP